MAVYLVLSIVTLIIIKHFVKDIKKQDIVVRCVGLLLFILFVWNRIELVVSNNNWAYIIPNSFCVMSSFVLSLTVMFGKRNNIVLHFVVYLAFLGSVLTLIYPDFIGQNISFFYGKTISGLLHHAISLYLVILLCLVGWFKPDYKKWPSFVIGFLCYITLGAFLTSVFGLMDSFYIFEPILSGTPLTVWVLAPIVGVMYVIFMVSYELIKRKFNKKKIIVEQLRIDEIIKEENSETKKD